MNTLKKHRQLPFTTNGFSNTRWAYWVPYRYSEVIRLLYYLPMEMWATEWFMKYQIQQLKKENKKLKEDIKKWEDRWMVKLAEIYVMPTRELTTAIAKNEWFSSWYDTVKKQMLHELWFDRLDVQDLLKENKKLKEENKKLREELSKKNMDTWFDEKAENIYKSQKENILMWKIC